MTALCFPPSLKVLLLCDDFDEVGKKDKVKDSFTDYKDEDEGLGE